MSDAPIDLPDCPDAVADFVRRALDAVRSSLGLSLEFDSETLPLLDHYLREVPDKSPDTAALIAAMAGAYFGETVRQCMGGSWKVVAGGDPGTWRIVLPGGLSFSPVRLALAAIVCDESDTANADFQAPPMLMQALRDALEHMGSVTAREYYMLSCRFDTLEHLQEVMLAVADERRKKLEGADAPN